MSGDASRSTRTSHAALQVERLSFAVRIAGEALAKGDIRAIAPFIKAIDRLDAYQTLARKAAPAPRPREPDALVVKALVDRIRRGIEAEMAAAAGSPDPAAAQAPALEAEPSPPPIEPEGPLASLLGRSPTLPAGRASPLASSRRARRWRDRRRSLLGRTVPAARRAGEPPPAFAPPPAVERGANRGTPGARRRADRPAEPVELRILEF